MKNSVSTRCVWMIASGALATAPFDLGMVEPFFAERDFKHLEPWLDQDNRLSRELGGALLPVTILFDANGEEVFRVTGGYKWDSEEAIAAVREGIAE